MTLSFKLTAALTNTFSSGWSSMLCVKVTPLVTAISRIISQTILNALRLFSTCFFMLLNPLPMQMSIPALYFHPLQAGVQVSHFPASGLLLQKGG